MKARYLSGLLECSGGAEVYSGLHPGCIRILLVMLGEVARALFCLILGAIAPGEGESCRPQLLRFLKNKTAFYNSELMKRLKVESRSLMVQLWVLKQIVDSRLDSTVVIN